MPLQPYLLLSLCLWCGCVRGEVLQNGGMERLEPWTCPGHTCTLVTTHHSGHHAIKASHRTHSYQGPSQTFHVQAGKMYQVTGFIKLLNDVQGAFSQKVAMSVEFTHPDGRRTYREVATHPPVKVSSGWVHLQGEVLAPSNHVGKARVYFQGPAAGVSFLVDDASVTEMKLNTDDVTWRNVTDHVIRTHRMSDIRVHVTVAAHINKEDVRIHVVQKKKSFPFGTAVSNNYNDAGEARYRDYIHTHFTWAVPENSLKWPHLEPRKGHANYQHALGLIRGLKHHGLKVRGHNLVWSKENNIQGFVKALSGDALRREVKHHIEETLNVTRGLLEHWDVNNENLHGTWYQDRLHDPDYDLELFNITHHADPHVKLFLNDFNVVASGSLTKPYLSQALRFKAAGVGLYGLGVQCHFHDEMDPNPYLIKERLDTLAKAGLPIWVTELDVGASDENRRADFYEHALRSLYGHPAVEGILFWGFWDHHHPRGEKAALVRGPNLEATAAGRRVLDLLENQWMTDDTRVMSQTGNQYTVRGFHGDYEVRVIYKGQELTHLKKTFTFGKSDHTVTVSVHT